jgi:6-phosphogluconate dehydrogenase (decarboxylating)
MTPAALSDFVALSPSLHSIVAEASQQGIAMELGMIGLGRMAVNVAERLARGGHRVISFDPKQEARTAIESQGAGSATSLQEDVITLSLIARRQSRDNESFSDKLLAAMRNQFGDHDIKTE